MKSRTLQKTVLDVSKSFPVLLLTGPRQVGKTTLLQACAEPGRGYVTLDDLAARALAKSDPVLFLQAYPPPVIIDEVQYAPELFSAIKMIVDQTQRSGDFWLTGSQKFHLMKGITESLAGRVAILDMLGLSKAEIEGRAAQVEPFLPTAQWIEEAQNTALPPPTLREVYTAIWRGSFPRLIMDPMMSRDLFYSSYVRTYIQRDVRDSLEISDELSFRKFLIAVAARTGQLLNYSDLARDCDIDPKTAKSWLSVLEASGLVYILHPYFTNVTKRIIKAPKVYFLDTGLCCYLTQWTSPESLEAGAMSGSILESYIFSEILKSYWNKGREPYVYYYRDMDQKEIDLLIEQEHTLYPIEIKKTASPTLDAAKNFNVLEKLGKIVGPGAVICLRDKDIPLSQKVSAIPVGYL